jgi:hypothetical protein
MRLVHLNRLLDDVGRWDGIAGLRLAADGTGGLQLKNGLRVFFEYAEQSDCLCIYTPVLPIPAHESERMRLYDAILRRVFLHHAAGSVAVAAHLEHVVFQVCLHAEDLDTLDAQRLDQAIDRVIERHAPLRRQLEQATLPQSRASLAQPAVPTLHSLRRSNPRH